MEIKNNNIKVKIMVKKYTIERKNIKRYLNLLVIIYRRSNLDLCISVVIQELERLQV
jgi:hypothetical protein